MKKFLAICLTLSMLLGCLAFVSVSAAEDEIIMINNCDVYDGGTNDYMTGDKPTRLVDTEDKTEGEGCWSSVLIGELSAGLFQRRTVVDPIDATEATALSFDLYLEDASMLDGCLLELELSSAGVADVEESSAVITNANMVDGWNTVVVSMNVFAGSCNMAAVNYFRIFNRADGANAQAGEGTLCKFDNLHFIVAAPAEPEEPAAPSYKKLVWQLLACDDMDHGLGIGGKPFLDEEDFTEGTACLGTTWEGQQGIASFNFNKTWTAEEGTVDFTKATHLAFDLYVSNASAFNGAPFSFEISSGGTCDVQELAYNASYDVLNLQDGWNTVKIPVGAFAASTGGACDKTAINFFRWFNADPSGFDAGEGLTVKIDNIRLEKNGDSISFIPQYDEADYIYKETAGTNAQKHFADANGEIVYRMEVPEDALPYVSKVTFTAPFSSQLLLEASYNGRDWVEIYRFVYTGEGDVGSNGMQGGNIEFDVTKALKLDQSNSVWIRVKDSYPQNGWGGGIGDGPNAPATLYWEYADAAVRTDAEFYTFAAREKDRGNIGDGKNTSCMLNLEDKYFVSSNAGKTGSGTDVFYFNDTNKTTVYKFELEDATDIEKITFSGRFSSQFRLDASTDGATWTTAFSGVLDQAYYTFDVTESVDMAALAESGVLYIQIGDDSIDNGNGGRVYGGCDTTLAVVHKCDHKDGVVGDDAVDPTPDAPGYTGTIYCSVCGVKLRDGDSIEYVCPHANTEVRDAVDATYDEPGYTGDTYCTDCGEKIADGEEIPVKICDHANTEIRDAVDATYTEPGYTGDTWCLDCGKKIADGEEIPVMICNHAKTEIRDAVEATDTTEGYTGDKWCLDCGKMIKEGTVIPVGGFAYTKDLKFALNAAKTGYVVAKYEGDEINIVIPSEFDGLPVVGIGYGAFMNTAIESIVIPTTVTEIQGAVFNGCTELKEIELPWSLKTLGNNVFASSGIESIVLPKNLQTMGTGVFFKCASLKSVVFEGTRVTNIKESTFKECTALTDIVLPESVKVIGKQAFARCTSLKTINIPAATTAIGLQIFNGATSLETVEIGEGNAIAEIPYMAFYNTQVKNIDLPATVTSIRDLAFTNNPGLESIDISGVTEINKRVFQNCPNLKTVVLSDNLTKIGYYAFALTGLTEIELPEGLTTIDAMAFYNIRTWNTLRLPSTLTSVGEKAFGYNMNLTTLYIDSATIVAGIDGTNFGCLGQYADTFVFKAGGAVSSYITANAPTAQNIRIDNVTYVVRTNHTHEFADGFCTICGLDQTYSK